MLVINASENESLSKYKKCLYFLPFSKFHYPISELWEISKTNMKEFVSLLQK